MGKHHYRFQALLHSYFVWLPHWSLTTCCFVPSALQYILHTVLKLLINLAFFFLKKAFVYWENLVSLLCDHVLAGCLSWCHPSIHNTSELECLAENTSWVLEVVGNTWWSFSSLSIKRINYVVPEDLFFLLSWLLVNPQFKCADWSYCCHWNMFRVAEFCNSSPFWQRNCKVEAYTAWASSMT